MDKVKALLKRFRKAALFAAFTAFLAGVSYVTGVDVTHLAGTFTDQTEAAIVAGEAKMQLEGVVTNP